MICVPVNGDIVWNVIGDFDQETIALSGYNGRARKFSIHRDNASGVAQSGYILHLDLQDRKLVTKDNQRKGSIYLQLFIVSGLALSIYQK